MTRSPDISCGDLQRHLKDFQTINRILTAFSSTKDQEDIFHIILCSLISSHGLNFSRSFLFKYDPRFDTFNGHLALGPADEKEAREFEEEMKKEEAALDAVMKNHPRQSASQKPDIWASFFSDLHVTSCWIHIVQKLGLQNPLTLVVRKLSYSRYGKRHGENFFHEICREGRPRIFERSQQDFPRGLEPILASRFIAIPVCSKSRPYGVVLVDRAFTDLDFNPTDLRHLQWFSNQAALAVENVVLYNNLQDTYNDLKQIDIMKSNFLSTISHELRTPLTTIHGFVELLMDGKVGEVSGQQRNLLERVARNSHHLINMVNDIIEVAEIQANGVTKIKVEPLDPVSLLMVAISNVKERKDNKTVNIDPEIEGEIPSILSEKHSLERIFYHILDNAVKFSPEGGRVKVRFKQENGELRISFSDEGIGIQPEYLNRIFDEFYQVDNKLNRAFEGLGLGLTITRLLLTSTGGKIFAESNPGHGSIFTIAYPVV